MPKLSIPQELLDAWPNPALTGDYLLSNSADITQPYSLEEFDYNEFAQPFDGESCTSQGLLCGAYRICNTGCEGYHIYVFSGPHEGEIWSDQRVPFGRLGKISDSLSEYLSRVAELGRNHTKYYEDFS
ncbi:MAG: hypothetical protein K0U72_13670 [Gammaproteobacteria bacterium]|nr:hypothetical protein [Gammaproteobacteria bacterium]